jgi:DNA-binding GntR family transcriptional regulator
VNPADTPTDTFAVWESAVAFRLFADQQEPALSIPDQVAARLGERILDGRMPPGARIAEQEVADEFAVSRGPVREALRILEREGLVTILPRRGALVTELGVDELRDLMEIRAGLFELVVRKLADRPHPELLALLEAGVRRLEELAPQADQGALYAETVYRIHILCARLSGNSRLQRMLTGLSLQTLRYSKLGLASVARRQRSVQLWREATEAFKVGDVERTVRLTRLRIEESGDEVSRLWQQRGAGGDA